MGNAVVKTVIDTHWHFDHTENNGNLHAGGRDCAGPRKRQDAKGRAAPKITYYANEWARTPEGTSDPKMALINFGFYKCWTLTDVKWWRRRELNPRPKM